MPQTERITGRENKQTKMERRRVTLKLRGIILLKVQKMDERRQVQKWWMREWPQSKTPDKGREGENERVERMRGWMERVRRWMERMREW